MKFLFFTLIFILPLFSYASTNLEYSSDCKSLNGNKFPSFKYKESSAVFVDFLTAKYNIDIDFKRKSSVVISSITLNLNDDGYPVFDLHNKIIELTIDGELADTSKINPPQSNTDMMVINKLLTKGTHKLVIKSELDEAAQQLDYENKFLDYDFLLSDLDDRNFLELYLPSSFEYDQYLMAIEINIKNTKHKHAVYTNGKIEKVAENHFKLNYPDYFNTSSLFLHIVKNDLYKESKFSFKSITGRSVPVRIYSDDASILNWSKKETIAVLHEMEKAIGPWPHPELLINMDGGAMEAHGALHGDKESLRHEIIHSYFGRGVMPLDGKSGWIDESLTYWIEQNYPKSNECDGLCLTNLSQYSPYLRHTPEDADGSFSSYLNFKLSTLGGLKKFLPYFFEKYKFKLIDTETFKCELESFYETNLEEDFKKYIFQ